MQCPLYGTAQQLCCVVSHRRKFSMHRTIDTDHRTNRRPCRMYVVMGLALLSDCDGGGGSSSRARAPWRALHRYTLIALCCILNSMC